MKSISRRKSILIVDDHVLLRQGLERLLNATDEFVVCEEAGDAEEALELVRELRPDAAIVDVGLPDTDGIELTRQLLAEFPQLVVVILSMHDDPELVERAAEAGAMGYILKSEAIEKLQTALRDVFNGRRHFSTDALKNAS